ncbi:hypothetical protein [Paenibacillus auburnensis]|uniref:hypothetical protein n=1 Tax=Paenibacillus auburnensis TaxID=2905649 RepID=UPI001F19802A|nr:hypothetical protein [Paenibacillus auburnensis]
MLEQALIAAKKPLHNYFTEDRYHTAKERYVDYMEKRKDILKEIVLFPKQEWDFAAYQQYPDLKDYYLKKYKIKNYRE